MSREPRPRRVVFVRTDRLGETLLTLPALQALRIAFPQAVLTMMVHPSLSELFRGHPDLNEVAAEPMWRGPWWLRAWRLSRLWRAWRADAILIANPRKEYHAAAWLAGIPTRVGYARKWGGLLTHRVSDREARGRGHEVESNVQLLRAWGIPVSVLPAGRLPVRAEDDAHISRVLAPFNESARALVVVHPWTSNPRKQWPLDRFRHLIQELGQQPQLLVAVIGGEDERPQAAALLSACDGVMNLVGRLPVRQTAALLRRARVLVSNDSGPMHLAAAVGTPVVALFGTQDAGSHPARWGPWGEGHTVIHRSLEAIPVEDVLAATLAHVG